MPDLYRIFSWILSLFSYNKIHVWDQINLHGYMKSKAFSTIELSDILRLVEIIPIDNGRLKKSINTRISLKDNQNNIDDKTLSSFLDRRCLLILLLLKTRARKRMPSASEIWFGFLSNFSK